MYPKCIHKYDLCILNVSLMYPSFINQTNRMLTEKMILIQKMS